MLYALLVLWIAFFIKDDLLRSATPQSTTPVDILHQAAFSPSTAPMDHTLGIFICHWRFWHRVCCIVFVMRLWAFERIAGRICNCQVLFYGVGNSCLSIYNPDIYFDPVFGDLFILLANCFLLFCSDLTVLILWCYWLMSKDPI